MRPTPLIVVGILVAGCTEFSVTKREDPATTYHPLIKVEPEFVDFELHTSQELVAETITVTNTGFALLDLSDVLISAPASFSLDLWDELPVSLDREETWQFDILFQPVDAGDIGGIVTVFSNALDEPEVPVEILGIGAVANLEIVPDPLDFRQRWIGCDETKAFTLGNSGSEPLVITDVHFGGDGRFFMGADVPMPLELASGQTYDVPITFDASLEGAGAGRLSVTSNDPRGLRAAETMGEAVYAARLSENFEVPESFPVDIMFAVDQSCSMSDEATALGVAFGDFISTVSQVTNDWKIGVVTADSGCFNTGVLTSSTANYASIFQSAVHGPEGLDTEKLLRLTQSALNGANGGCNNGFLDAGAPLHLVMVSDEKDQSPQSWGAYVADYQSRVATPADVTVHAVVDLYRTCGTGNGGDGPGGYLEAAQATGGEILDICNSSWSSQLSQIATAAVANLQSYPLSNSSIDAASVQVRVDGVIWTQDWHYDATTNAVVFDVEMASGQAVDVSYGILAPCP